MRGSARAAHGSRWRWRARESSRLDRRARREGERGRRWPSAREDWDASPTSETSESRLPATTQGSFRQRLQQPETVTGVLSADPPRNGERVPEGAPPTSDALLAFRADGGVVRSTDGAPLAHPPCRVCSRRCVSITFSHFRQNTRPHGEFYVYIYACVLE
eukprot:scaffold27053_cov72-Phaeocystis_antarctica.AAC.3